MKTNRFVCAFLWFSKSNIFVHFLSLSLSFSHARYLSFFLTFFRSSNVNTAVCRWFDMPRVLDNDSNCNVAQFSMDAPKKVKKEECAVCGVHWMDIRFGSFVALKTTWQFYEISIDKCFLICIWINCKHISCFTHCLVGALQLTLSLSPSLCRHLYVVTKHTQKLYAKNYARIHYIHFGRNLFTFFPIQFPSSWSYLSYPLLFYSSSIFHTREFSQFTWCKLFVVIFLVFLLLCIARLHTLYVSLSFSFLSVMSLIRLWNRFCANNLCLCVCIVFCMCIFVYLYERVNDCSSIA